jgi:hypothetical protein
LIRIAEYFPHIFTLLFVTATFLKVYSTDMSFYLGDDPNHHLLFCLLLCSLELLGVDDRRKLE